MAVEHQGQDEEAGEASAPEEIEDAAPAVEPQNPAGEGANPPENSEPEQDPTEAESSE